MAESTNYPEVPPEVDSCSAPGCERKARFVCKGEGDDGDFCERVCESCAGYLSDAAHETGTHFECCAAEAAEPRVFEETLTFSLRRFLGA